MTRRRNIHAVKMHVRAGSRHRPPAAWGVRIMSVRILSGMHVRSGQVRRVSYGFQGIAKMNDEQLAGFHSKGGRLETGFADVAVPR